MGWADSAFYSGTSAYGSTESDCDRHHESWQHGNRMDRVIHCSAVFQKDQTCGTPFSAGIIGFPLRDELPAEELCGTGPYEVVAGLQCLIAAQPDWSFPSGHASASFASAVVIYKSCPRGIGVPALVLAFAISLSRLYVGVHYPSDVIVGMVIGTLIALILFWIFGEKKYKARARRR